MAIPDATESHEEGDQPTSAELDRDGFFGSALGLLNQAGRGEYTAFALNNAMSAVARPQIVGSPPITAGQRDQLLEAAIRAELTLLTEFSGAIDEEEMRLGMRALSMQIVAWADTDEARRTRREPMSTDYAAHARILRNELHNADLREMLRGEGRAKLPGARQRSRYPGR